jgi:hypothetical protein
VLRDGAANVALVSSRYGDCLRSSWSNILELVLRLDKLDLMPPALDALLDTDVWGVASPRAAPAGQQQQQQQDRSAPAAAAAAGGPVTAAVAPPTGAVGRPLRTARQRRSAGSGSSQRGRAGGVVGGGFLRSVTQLIALQEPEYEAKYATQVGPLLGGGYSMAGICHPRL